MIKKNYLFCDDYVFVEVAVAGVSVAAAFTFFLSHGLVPPYAFSDYGSATAPCVGEFAHDVSVACDDECSYCVECSLCLMWGTVSGGD